MILELPQQIEIQLLPATLSSLLLHKEKHDLVLDAILPFLLEQIQAAETTWGEELDEQDECLWQIECKLRQQLRVRK